MSMADQYDDGRYDGAETEVYNAKTDQWLPAGDPRLPKPKRSNGWNQVNTRQKATTMPKRLTKAQIDHELRVNDQLIKELRNRRQDLQRQAQTALPAEPPNCTMFKVRVQFKRGGRLYEYLILKSGGHYWTTGTKQDQQVFSSWETLCEWLEGPDVYSHSDIHILQNTGRVVSFTSGSIESTDEQAPF